MPFWGLLRLLETIDILNNSGFRHDRQRGVFLRFDTSIINRALRSGVETRNSAFLFNSVI